MSVKEEDVALFNQYLEEKNVVKILEVCESLENKNAPRFFYHVFLLCYLVTGDLNNARFLWKRTPEHFKKSPEYQEIWQVGRFMWEKQNSQVYKKVVSVQWSAKLIPLVKMVSGNFRRKTVRTISTAYSSIAADQFGGMVGYSKDQVNQFVKDENWEFDGQFIYPKPFGVVKKKKKVQGADLVKSLTEKHLFLELNN